MKIKLKYTFWYNSKTVLTLNHKPRQKSYDLRAKFQHAHEDNYKISLWSPEKYNKNEMTYSAA